MVKKKEVLRWLGLLGVIIIVSNNVTQFSQSLVTGYIQGDFSPFVIVILITFGVLWDLDVFKKLK